MSQFLAGSILPGGVRWLESPRDMGLHRGPNWRCDYKIVIESSTSWHRTIDYKEAWVGRLRNLFPSNRPWHHSCVN